MMSKRVEAFIYNPKYIVQKNYWTNFKKKNERKNNLQVLLLKKQNDLCIYTSWRKWNRIAGKALVVGV